MRKTFFSKIRHFFEKIIFTVRPYQLLKILRILTLSFLGFFRKKNKVSFFWTFLHFRRFYSETYRTNVNENFEFLLFQNT